MRICRKKLKKYFQFFFHLLLYQRGEKPYNTVAFKTWMTYPEKNKDKNLVLLHTHAFPTTAHGSSADLAA